MCVKHQVIKILLFFIHLKLWVAVARHNFKSVNIGLSWRVNVVKGETDRDNAFNVCHYITVHNIVCHRDN